MKAITFENFGDAEVLEINEVSDPSLRSSDLLVRVEALRAESPIERLAEGVVGWLAWTREVDLHSIPVSPQIDQLTGEQMQTLYGY